MKNPLALLGHTFLGLLAASGRLGLFTFSAVTHCFRPPFFLRQFLRQMMDIGYFSLPVVGLTALFTGMVLALQSYTGFSRFEGDGAIATVVVLSVTRELGPVMAGLMVARCAPRVRSGVQERAERMTRARVRSGCISSAVPTACRLSSRTRRRHRSGSHTWDIFFRAVVEMKYRLVLRRPQAEPALPRREGKRAHPG